MARFQRVLSREGEKGLFVYGGGFIVADMIADADSEKSIELTEHAIEDGSSVSDHAVRKPVILNFTLVQTQKPIYPTEGFGKKQISLTSKSNPAGKQTSRLTVRKKLGFQANAQALISAGITALRGAAEGDPSIVGMKPGAAQGAPLKVTALTADAPVDRVNAFADELWRLVESVTVVSVSWKGKDYPGYVLTSARRTDSAGQGGRSTFAVSLKQLITVATKQVTLPAVPAAKKTKSGGAKDTKKEAALPPDNRTILAAGQDAGFAATDVVVNLFK
jgi:hypothetical protein